jgi:hypothetical protein
MKFDEKVDEFLLELSQYKKHPLVLDENLLELLEPLELANFKIFTVPQKSSDEYVKKMAAGGLTILTKNSKHFIKDAVRLDYDIISLDHLGFIDPIQTIQNKTAKLIRKAFQETGMGIKRGNFMISFQKDGTYEFKEFKRK